MGYSCLPDALVTGIDVIDRDHDQLFCLIEEFREAKAEHNLGLLKTVIYGLVEYTVYHFKKEEMAFEVCGYPETEKHCKEHRKLEATALGLQAELEDHPEAFTPEKLEEIDAFLVDWLDNHITKSDMTYKEKLLGSPEALRAMKEFSFASHLGAGADDTDPLGDILGDLEG